jgi:phage shock protein A
MAQIQAVAARQELLEAQYSTAEAHVQVHEALGGVSEELDGLGDALEQAEQRTDRMQARASALDRLVDAGVLDMPVGDWPSLASTEDQTSEVVEERLAALKRQAAPCD